MSFFSCSLSASPFSDKPDTCLTGAGAPEDDLAPAPAVDAEVGLPDAAGAGPDLEGLVEAGVGADFEPPEEVEVGVDLAGVEVGVD